MRSYSWVSAVCQLLHEIVVLAACCVSVAWYYWALLCVPGSDWDRIIPRMLCAWCRMV